MLLQKTTIIKFLLPRLQDVLFVVVFTTALIFGQRMLNLDVDLPRHLLTGKYILQTGTVPITEPFVYPYEDSSYVSHEWLADIIFYVVYYSAGLTGIVLLSATLLAATFSYLYATAVSRTNIRLPALLLVAWGAAATSLNWATRPHLFTMLFLSIWLSWMDSLARGNKIPLWRFPLFMVLWSNMHGEFIAGFLVLIAYATGYTWDYFFARGSTQPGLGGKMWLILLLSFLASLANPYGLRPWTTMLGFVNNSYLMSRMAEANSPDFHQAHFLVLLGLLAFSMILLAINQTRLSTGKAFLLAGFSAMSLMATRNIHLYGIVAPFVLAEVVSWSTEIRWLKRSEEILGRIEDQLRGVVWPLVTTLAFCLVLLLGTGSRIFQFSPLFFPVSAVDWLEGHPQEGRMFNDLNWGGYIAFHLWPEQRVFVDSMSDVTGEITRQYETVITTRKGWEDVLLQYDIQWMIVPVESDIVKILQTNAYWDILYADRLTIILGRH